MSVDTDKMSGDIVVLTWTSSEVEFNYNEPTFQDFTFKAEVSPTPSGNRFTSKDSRGLKLVQELSKNLMNVQVNLSFIGKRADDRTRRIGLCDLELLLTSGEDNVLKELRERFGDKIKLSVYLKPENGDRGGSMFSAEKMTICSGKFLCKRRLGQIFNEYFPALIIGRISEWILTIKIHIPGHLALGDVAEVKNANSPTLDEPHPLKMLDEKVFCDLTISARNGAVIEAHRVYMCAASPVLRAELEKKMRESNDTGTLDMEDMSEKGVRAFLRYLYGKDLAGPKDDVEVAMDLLYAGHKYQLPKLKDAMASLLEGADDDDFGVQVAFRMYSFMKRWNPSSQLIGKAILILKLNWDALEELQEYQQLFKDSPDFAILLCRDVAKSQIGICLDPGRMQVYDYEAASDSEEEDLSISVELDDSGSDQQGMSSLTDHDCPEGEVSCYSEVILSTEEPVMKTTIELGDTQGQVKQHKRDKESVDSGLGAEGNSIEKSEENFYSKLNESVDEDVKGLKDEVRSLEYEL